MVAVRVMEMPLHEVVHVIAVRHGVMTAAGTVCVPARVALARVPRRTGRGIGGVHGDGALVDMVTVHSVEMAIV
jgi:hypothetical protein